MRIHYFFSLLLITCCGCTTAIAAPMPRYQIVDLGTLGGNASYAASINDRGQIVGLGFHDKKEHSFLLTPIPASRRS